MPMLEKMAPRKITDANYITSINGMLHPDRILSEHDFLYMLDGSWEIFEEGNACTMQSGDLLILTAGRHHYGIHKCNPGNRHMYIHTVPTASERRINEAEKDSSPPAGGRKGPIPEYDGPLFSCPSLVHCQANPRIRQYFHEIISACWADTPEKQNRLSLLFNLMLCELSEMIKKDGKPYLYDPMVEDIMRLIHSTPQTFFSAKELSCTYFICERTLNNRFKKACGKTFSVYQMDTKLEMVRRFLLTQPQAKLHEAAVNFGFCDEFHLSKAFRKKFGQPPSHFRGKAKQPAKAGSWLQT